ncbi:Uncharacterised protein [Mycobacteroides abscessus subsp. abscessus]|nr:Uncharacterised protein [Mycobacteroides abscessus subsp. abscessus]
MLVDHRAPGAVDDGNLPVHLERAVIGRRTTTGLTRRANDVRLETALRRLREIRGLIQGIGTAADVDKRLALTEHLESGQLRGLNLEPAILQYLCDVVGAGIVARCALSTISAVRVGNLL